MDSILNFKRHLSEADTREERHKIWSPIPRKLQKIEHDYSNIQHQTSNEESFLWKIKSNRTASQHFSSTNSAFR